MSQNTDPTGARRRDGQIRPGATRPQPTRRSAVFIVLAVLVGVVAPAQASVSIRGVAHPKYLISSVPAMSASDAVLKMVFENKTPGTNVSLCAGTMEDFADGKCAMHLSGSGGPGFQFLTIIDARELYGKVLYAIRAVGTAPAQFVLTIE
jgi:hypothetical protein